MPIASKPRARLSEPQVIAIFQAKATGATSTEIATVFGMSETAVRDIWSGRTWSRETWRLDTSRPFQHQLPGRVKRCKARNPRRKSALQSDELRAWTAAQVSSSAKDNLLASNPMKGYTFIQETLQMPHNQHSNQGFTQCTDAAACFENSNTWYQAGNAWLIASTVTIRHVLVDEQHQVSVDEQLHEWDTFWRSSASTDPFCAECETY
jgi:hypothetical protein